jgi:hypothetical protein
MNGSIKIVELVFIKIRFVKLFQTSDVGSILE